jgi:prevent-host-death family protein
MVITATEFKTNIGKYLMAVDDEEVLITKNGKGVAKLVSVRSGSGKSSSLSSLRGILKGADVSLESIREERLARYRENNG